MYRNNTFLTVSQSNSTSDDDLLRHNTHWFVERSQAEKLIGAKISVGQTPQSWDNQHLEAGRAHPALAKATFRIYEG
jgi:hypothetical protein